MLGNPRIVIIGAGVAGLAAAMRLREACVDAIPEITILEAESQPGGLLQTTTENGYWWDNGAFMFRTNNPLYHLFPELFQPVDSRVEVWLRGVFHAYPPSARSWIRSQPPFAFLMTALDLVYCYGRRYLGLAEANLHDWLRYRITARFLDHTQLEAYFAKLQGRATRELSSRLGELRLDDVIKGTSLRKIVRRFLRSKLMSRGAQRAIQVREIYPSECGVGAISRALVAGCEAGHIKILCDANVTEIVRDGEGEYAIRYQGKGGHGICRASHLISTMPLNEFVATYRSHATLECLDCAEKLAFMDLKLVFFITRRPVIRHNHLALYSFEKHHRWKRLVARSLPNGLSQVLVETTFDPRAGEPEDSIAEMVTKDLVGELALFDADEVMLRRCATVRKAYPIHEIGYETRVARILQELESDTVQCAGRQGRFAYLNTKDVIQTAWAAADRIAQSVSACPTAQSARRKTNN